MAVSDDSTTQQAAVQIRQSVADAYSFVAGQQASASFSALTFEELCQQQIDRISGPGTDSRPNELDRITAITSALTSAIAQVKSIPANAFKLADDATDVNTTQAQEDVVARQQSLLSSGT